MAIPTEYTKQYKFCSKEYYNYLKTLISKYFRIIPPIKTAIPNNFCNGYCKKINNLFDPNLLPDYIISFISQFVYSDVNLKHKILLYDLLNQSRPSVILSYAIIFNRYNSTFKKIFEWCDDHYLKYYVFKSLVEDKDGIKSAISNSQYIIFMNKSRICCSGGYFQKAFEAMMPNYIDLLYNDTNLCLSFVQRKSSKQYISPDTSKKILTLNRLIMHCLQIFASKNITRLISFYI